MISPGIYYPGTKTNKRPTPVEFIHLRKWIPVDERFIDLTNIEQLVDVNLQLEQSSRLYVSNVIQRVIAQLLGKYGDGFVTLEATEDGRLKVDALGNLPTILRAVIDENTAATHEIIPAVVAYKIKIKNIMLTVAGETLITFQSDTTVLSGPLNFGGTDEPRGMVHNFGDAPLETVSGEAFKITLSAAVQLSGYVTYYTE